MNEGTVLLLEFTVRQRQQHKHSSNGNMKWPTGQGHKASKVSRRGRMPAVCQGRLPEAQGLGRYLTGGAGEEAFQGKRSSMYNRRPHRALSTEEGELHLGLALLTGDHR